MPGVNFFDWTAAPWPGAPGFAKCRTAKCRGAVTHRVGYSYRSGRDQRLFQVSFPACERCALAFARKHGIGIQTAMLLIVALVALLGCSNSPSCAPLPSVASRPVIFVAVDWSTLPAYLDEGAARVVVTESFATWGLVEGPGGAELRWGELDRAYLGYTVAPCTVTLNTRIVWSLDWCDDGQAYDLESVLLHELGHLEGLGHTPPGENAIMAPTIGACEERRACR